MVKPTHFKRKANPNIQTSGQSVKKVSIEQDIKGVENEGSIGVNYKSDRSAVPKGPSDQGATATLVRKTIHHRII